MFDIGWSELVVIGIVALIAIGPKELPGVLRGLGQWMGKIRRMANEFQGQFQEAMREAELSDLQKEATEITNSISNYDPVAETQKELEKTFDNPDPLAEPTPAASATESAGAEQAALPAPEEHAALPAPEPVASLDVPLPDHPAPVTEKDFAAVEPVPPEIKKQAGGSA